MRAVPCEADDQVLVVTQQLSQKQRKQWDELASLSRVARLCSSAAWGDMVAVADGIAPTFFLLYEGEELVAGTVGDLMPRGVPAKYDVEQLLARGTSWSPSRSLLPCLTLTTRAGDSCDIRIRDDERRDELVGALLRHLVRYAYEDLEASGVALLLAPAETELLRIAEDVGFVGAVTDVSYYLDIDFDDFEGYLLRMPSKRRVTIRGERRKLRELGDFTFDVVPLAEHVDLYVHYAFANLRKYDMIGEGGQESMRRRAVETARQFGAAAQLLVMRRGGEPVGMTFIVDHGDQLNARVVGYDPDLPKPIAPYFQLTYYEVVELALARGRRRIVYGHELGAVKRSRGCQSEEQQLLLHEPAADVTTRLRELDTAGIR